MNEVTLLNESKELSTTKKNQGLMSVESQRAATEIEAMVYVAKQFPRVINESYSEIMQACERTSFAEKALYGYPKGGQLVKGASIHLAKEMARCWGNIEFGIKELSQENGESVVLAYCWDVQKNTREQKVFTVKHTRDTKKGKITLTDSRDIYELVANMGARRLRACIMGVLPRFLAEDAENLCNKTLEKGGNGKPLKDRVREMLFAFDKIGVSEKLIEKRLGFASSAILEINLVDLRAIYVAITTGEGRREQFFDIGSSDGGHADQLNNLDLTPKTEEPKKEAPPEPKKEPEKKPEPQHKPEAKKPEPKKQNDTIDLPSFE
jgi:hypothetical protein